MRRPIKLLILTLLVLTACSRPAATAQPSAPPSVVEAGPSTIPAFSPTATPTLMPLFPESLTNVELHQRLDPFSAVEGSCPLPCYNGLTAGQSNMQDVLVFYSHLGIGATDLIPGDYEAAQDGSGRLSAWLTKTSDVLQAEEMGLVPPLVNVYLQDNVVQYVYVGWEYLPPYLHPSHVLEQLGQPDGLNLALLFNQNPPSYLLQFVYTQKGIGVAFSGPMPGDSSLREVCLSSEQVNVTVFGVFIPGTVPMEGLSNAEYLLPLEAALGLSYTDFADLLSAGECLGIPAAQWTPWQTMQSP